MQILNYKIIDTLNEGKRHSIYRAEDKDKRHYILKILNAEYPIETELNKFQKEFRILKKFYGVKGIAEVIALEKYKNGFLMVFKDSQGENLSSNFFYKIPLYTFYKIAKLVLTALDKIHEKRIIHRNINPSNILYDSYSGNAEIIDFSSSVELDSEFFHFELKGNMEGNLSYISPEQSGRMNRLIDYRTDYYSLGATFYKLLTGRPPFIANDSMDLIYYHIAKDPLPPHEFDKSIPVELSKIILKLLAKNPDDRYQSAFGAVHDLDWLNSTQYQSEKFVLGKKDFSLKFNIPQKLYGRENEIRSLVDTFDYMYKNGRPELSVITGVAGIGKSALVKEILKPISLARGYFIVGEYDQSSRNLPLSGLIKAFSSLIQILLTETSEEISNWKKRILFQLGSNGSIVTDVLPDLELIIGKQSLVPSAEPNESSNRFYLVFQNFIRSFCTLSHPLVLFLDDVQWADNASIQMIGNLMSDRSFRYIYIILSIRVPSDNSNNYIFEVLDSLKKEKIFPRTVSLSEISLIDTKKLLVDCFYTNEEEVNELADLISQKTGGNPFFIVELLKELEKEGKIYPDHISGKWLWDLSKIQKTQISDNILELLIFKIQKLSNDSQSVLKIAACIGQNFDLWTISVILKKSIQDSFKILKDLVVQDFLYIPKSYIKRVNFDSENNIKKEQAKLISYQFQHDRIQQAAYKLIDINEGKSLQLSIGRFRLRESYSEDSIFEIVSHFNAGVDNIQEIEERLDLIKMNLKAARKAKLSTAYESAIQYLIHALNLVSDHSNPWKEIPDLTIQVYRELVELYYLSLQFEKLENSVSILLSNSNDLSEMAHAFKLLINYYTNVLNYEKALSCGRTALAHFEIILPEDNIDSLIQVELKKIRKFLKFRSIKSLNEAPMMNDKMNELAISLLSSLMPPVYFQDSELWIFIVLKSVNILLTFGNSESVFAYSCYGMILGSLLQDYKSGNEFGLLALSLTEKFKNKAEFTKSANIYANCILPFNEHLKNASQINLQCLEAGRESGEFQHISYSLIFNALNSFYMGTNLSVVLNEIIPKYMTLCKQTKSGLGTDTLNALRIVILGMTISRDDRMESEVILEYEKKFLSEWKSNNNFFTVSIYQILKIQNYFLQKYYQEAFDLILKAKSDLKYVIGLYVVAELNFYESLVLCALIKEADKETKDDYSYRIKTNQKQMKSWAINCPENFKHKYILISAEYERVKGRYWKATKLYDEAIEEARKNEFLHIEAIANELCAKAYSEIGKNKIMRTYQLEAHYLFSRWGGIEKISYIENENKDLFSIGKGKEEFLENNIESKNELSENLNQNLGKFLDLNTVIRAFQALTEEIVIEKLMRKVLSILFENAGAEKGLFLRNQNEEFTILAKGSASEDEIETFITSVNSDQNRVSPEVVPLSLINYVGRVKHFIVLAEASEEDLFINDPYLRNKKPKSILCYPVLRHEELVGIIYLENNLTTNAFTKERLEIINVLATQIAISIENSELYANLEAKVEERTSNLNSALHQVKSLKEKQDGDYFLTSLLIQPLGKNDIQSENVRIEFLIEQKKKFTFKNKDVEIGGDLCTVDRIFLHNRSYIVILNADAMGKSIQGAGGILVLGSVFKSILQRAYSESLDNSMFPEKWIKNSFLEMQKIFESFDGYMLISLILGLLDEESGILYFINVEHPRTVLFRNNQASFIEKEERTFRKMGIQGITSSIYLSLFQMESGDVLIFGSDGRDDVIIGQDEYGLDILNFDEKLFLSFVENGNGKLDEIFTELKSKVELNDDLSLIRLSYKEFEKKTDQEKERDRKNYESSLNFLKSKVVESTSNKDMESLIKTYKELILQEPLESQNLISISIILFKLKSYERFIEYAELIKLRLPNHLRNTLRLVISYIRIKNYQRAGKLVNEILTFDPANKKGRFLEQILSDLIIRSL